MAVVTFFARNRLRPPWDDVATALIYFALGAALYATPWYGQFSDLGLTVWHVPAWWRLGPLAVGCATILLRKRKPMLALGIGVLLGGFDVLLGFSLPILIVLTELLFCATLHSSPRANRILVATVCTILLLWVVTVAVLVRDWQVTLLATLQAFLLLFVPVWWAMTVRHHRDAAEAARAHAEQLATIAELDRRDAVANERARMARDLHDVIASHLSAIALQSEAVLSMVNGNPDTVRTVLRSVRENSVQALTEMRAMIDVLRADGAEDDRAHAGSHAAPARLRDIGRLLASAGAGGLTVSAPDLPGEADRDLPVAVDLAAYRIVQEALANAAKHAPGSQVRVAVRPDGEQLVVEVTNSLVKGQRGASNGRGTGLVSMRERAQAVGGSFAAGPRENEWRVHAVLPTGGRNQ